MAASVDYGYGDTPDYGYGETDYGYGDAKPAEVDYGYGDGGAKQDDYGYGDAKPDEPSSQEERRPKRRCSVTRYSIAPQQAPLNAAAVINDLRNGADVETLGDVTVQVSSDDNWDESAPTVSDNKKKGGAGGRFKGMFRRGK
jgi:hypothetical protein